MTKKRTVALYGNSLVVSSVGASLRACMDVELVQVDAALPDAAQRLGALSPVAVVFDLATARPDFAIALLTEHPQVLLIGVDVTGAKMLVLSGKQATALTTRDLAGIIEKQARAQVR